MTDGPYGAEPYPGQPTPYAAPPPGAQPGYGATGYPPPAAGSPNPGYANPGYANPGYSAPGYGAPTYPPPGYPAAPLGYGAAPRNGLGTAALVLGIIGVVLCWIPFTGWALNILAVIFGGVGMGRAKRGEATNKSSALAGLVLGAIGLAVWIVIVIVMAATASVYFRF